MISKNFYARFDFLFFFSCIFFSQYNLLFSQVSTATITGKVTDSTGLQPLTGISILVSGINYETLTDLNGTYIINDIPTGVYSLVASALGYKTVVKKNVRIAAHSLQYIDFHLSEKLALVPEVTIRPRNFQEDFNEFTGSLRLSKEEIKRIPGNLDDVVRSVSVLPGIAQMTNYRNDMIVRGGAPSENLFLVDGMIVPNINHFGSQGNTGGIMSYINMDYVNSVTFSTGGFSALYGDKISSVMEISLKDGKKDHLGGKVVISATQFGLNLEGPLNQNTDFIVSARRSYLDLVFKASGFIFAPQYYDLFAKVHSKISNSSSVSIIFLGAMDNVKFFEKESDERYSNPRAMGSNQKQYVAGISYKNIFSKGYYNLSFNRNSINYETVPNFIFENHSIESEDIFKSDFVFSFAPTSELNFGTITKVINFKTDIKLYRFRTTFEEELKVNSLSADNQYLKTGAYVQFNKLLWDKLRLNVGGRIDFFDGTTEEYTTSPRFALQYSLSELTDLSLSMGIYHQAPNSLWIAADSTNMNLLSTRSDQLVLGIEQKIDSDMRVKFEGFYKQYRHYPTSILRPYLVMANTGAGFAGVDDNFAAFGIEPLRSSGKGLIRGIEFTAQKKISDSPFHGMLNVTYSEVYFWGLDGVKRPGSYDQRWIINFAAGVIFYKNWEFDVKFRFASGMPYTPFNSDGTQSADNYNTGRMEDQHSLDIRIDREWKFDTWNLRTYLDIQNIYNHKVKSLIRWEKSENRIADDPVIGIIPSIGISLEF